MDAVRVQGVVHPLAMAAPQAEAREEVGATREAARHGCESREGGVVPGSGARIVPGIGSRFHGLSVEQTLLRMLVLLWLLLSVFLRMLVLLLLLLCVLELLQLSSSPLLLMLFQESIPGFPGWCRCRCCRADAALVLSLLLLLLLMLLLLFPPRCCCCC